jgi:hypothetical protein
MADPTAQHKAIDLAAAFRDQDLTALELMDGPGRAEQERVRVALYLYADGLWDHVKAQARRQSGDLRYNTAADPAYSGVAGMRDLAAELLANVHDAQHRAGEQPGNLPFPAPGPS